MFRESQRPASGVKTPAGGNFHLNMHITRELAAEARRAGVSIEAELGWIGGSEDGEAVAETLLADPEAARRFTDETGVDTLAVAIGTSHGFYKLQPNLDFERLAASV